MYASVGQKKYIRYGHKSKIKNLRAKSVKFLRSTIKFLQCIDKNMEYEVKGLKKYITSFESLHTITVCIEQ